MFFEVTDEIYLLLIKSKKMSLFKKTVLVLKILWNILIVALIVAIPFIAILNYLS